jgi:Domain of unknown function (DUF3472).
LLIIVVLAFAIAVAAPMKAIALSLRQAHGRDEPQQERPIRRSYRDQLGLPSAGGVRPDQTYSKWSWPGSGYYTDTAQRLTVESGTTPDGRYFWAYHFFFEDLGAGADGGYVGLQDESDPNGTKIALFSIWHANDSEGNCKKFTEGDPGISCRIDPYNWQTDREYRLKIQRDGSDTGGTWWKATVLDTVTMAQQTIGRIRVPPTWGNVQGVESFTEYWGDQVEPLPTCADLPRSRVRFKYPVANAGSVLISGHMHDIQKWDCLSTIEDLDGADRHVVPKGPK